MAVVHFVGFSYLAYRFPLSIPEFVRCILNSEGTHSEIVTISLGGLSIDGLVGLLPVLSSKLKDSDIIFLEVGTSAFSINGGSFEQALEILHDITRHIYKVCKAHLVFLNLYRPDLKSDDTVLNAIEFFCKVNHFAILNINPIIQTSHNFETEDGVHPSLETRKFMAKVCSNYIVNFSKQSSAPLKQWGPPKFRFFQCPSLSGNGEFLFKGKGFTITSQILIPGDCANFPNLSEHLILGIYFLYGPETGFIKVEYPGHEVQYIRSFDRRSYYRRLGYCALNKPAHSISLYCSDERPVISTFKESHLEVFSRREFICGLLISSV